jgi:hypothetical protein
VQRVHEVQAAQLLARVRGQHRAGELVALQAFFDQRLGQHQQAARRVHQRVDQLGVEVQRLVGGDGPGGGGPDDGERVLAQRWQAEGGRQLAGSAHRKPTSSVVLFLSAYSISNSASERAAVKAPVHGLEAAVDKAALHHALEGADLVGLVAEVHGAVRVLPVAQHAQALEVRHLDGDLLGGEGTALGLHLVARQVAAVLLLDGVFDRQAVAVPAGDVLRVQPLSWRALTIMSFRILLTAWPMWIWPLA